MKICAIFNPTARGGKARRFREHLRSLGDGCTLKATRASGDARRLAAEAVQQRFEVLVAAGGDGTVNEVANGIADVPGGLKQTRLAVIPLGTVNVFAQEIELPTTPSHAWDVIKAGHESTIDLIQAAFSLDGRPVHRHLVQLAGAGLDSSAISFVDWNQKKRLGQLAYILAGIKALRAPKEPVLVKSNEQTGRGQLVLVGNGRYYGGKFNLFPQADYRDGLIEVSVFPRANIAAVLRCGWGLLSRKLYSSGGACHIQSNSVELSSEKPVPFQLDGDNVGMLPVTFTVLPRALRILHPANAHAFQK